METPSDSSASVARFNGGKIEIRRPRAILSCIPCRDRKLKCDRGHPCNNCRRRQKQQECRYFGSTQSTKIVAARSSTTSELNLRLQRLEDLLVLLNSQQNPENNETPAVSIHGPTVDAQVFPKIPPQGSGNAPAGPLQLGPSDRSVGSIFTSREGTTYVEASHWQAILDDIQDVKDFLQHSQSADSPSQPSFDGIRSQRPALLFSSTQPVTREDVSTSLPPRSTVDRLISRFFNSGEPGIMILHVPTFLREYEEFWREPNSVSMAWLGLLHSILCMSIFFHARSEQPLPSPLVAEDDLVEYQARAAQCIRQSDYTKAGKHKLEALLIYLATEYFVSADAQLGVSICLSITIRLAMHMGVHRDSERFPKISVFEGEMRRRAWSLITQVERLTSFQLGLPSMVDRSQCNTGSPHNYQDSDIHDGMSTLPPERPASEKTIVSYTIAKDKVIHAFANVVDSVCGNDSPPYDTILHLERELENARASLPAFLQMRPLNMSFTDPADLIMQRYNIELLYLKARCVLHRQYMSQSTNNPAFAGSRSICLDSAKRTLRHQSDIHQETQPGGQLHQDRWFISSLTTSDFLVAAMILCLEAARRVYESKDTPVAQILSSSSTKEILSLLEQSRQIWLDSINISREAGSASEAIEKMLKHVEDTATHAPSSSSSQVAPQAQPGERAQQTCRFSSIIKRAGDEATRGLQSRSSTKTTATTTNTSASQATPPSLFSQIPTPPTPSPPEMGFEDYLSTAGFDWQSWDMAVMQNERNADRLIVDMPGSMEDVHAGVDERGDTDIAMGMAEVGVRYERS